VRPSIISGPLRVSKIWIDDALGGPARCRRVALRQRRIAAFVIVAPSPLIDMQANRIGRIIRLGLSRCPCQDRCERQNRQSRNAHSSLPKCSSHLRPPLRPQPDFPTASRQALLFPVNSRSRALGRARVVGHMHEHRLGAMQIENRAAGTFHEVAARLARFMAGRLQALGVPHRIFRFGPTSLIAPCLKNQPRCGSTAMRARNPRGPVTV
jgi:hypothetical protein